MAGNIKDIGCNCDNAHSHNDGQLRIDAANKTKTGQHWSTVRPRPEFVDQLVHRAQVSPTDKQSILCLLTKLEPNTMKVAKSDPLMTERNSVKLFDLVVLFGLLRMSGYIKLIKIGILWMLSLMSDLYQQRAQTSQST